MASDEIREGDVGTVLEVEIREDDVALDVSDATTKQILLRQPDGTTLTKTATFSSDGTDGRIRYVVVDGDLTAGRWAIQGRVVTGSGEWSTEIEAFKVHPNL